jgi:hypothetical protein
MTSPDLTAPAPGLAARATAKSAPTASTPSAASFIPPQADVLQPDSVRARETFIPVTTYALIDRLTQPQAWAPGEARAARRFFRYLEYWRRQQHGANLLELLEAYEAFSPDSDLLVTRTFTPEERLAMQERVIQQIQRILRQANYVRVDTSDLALILTKESHYGLDLFVDFKDFEECLIYYRGASTRRDQRRTIRKFLRKEEFDVPIFQRLFLLFKQKPLETAVRDLMKSEKLPRREAEKVAKRRRALLPASVKEDNIYIKLFKNLPRTDLEMVFPNTQVKFRLYDKLRLGLTAGGGLGVGAVGAAGKLAVAFSNPIMAAGALVGLGGIAFRQAVNFMNQKQRYMVVMAQNLYFHSMADNRGVLIKLADRAAEEDVKEEILLYSVLIKEEARRSDLPAIDAAIEQYLSSSFGVTVDFDLEDALERLIADGLVTEDASGHLRALSPRDAAHHLDAKWDVFLDNLPDPGAHEGNEVEGVRPEGPQP